MDYETHNAASCERAEDLIAVLYGEASNVEKRDFELHLKQCGSCRAEFNAFAQVRESIGEWRDEVLTGFVASSHVASVPVKKSARAALRQFFDLSPLWLKGAVGFAAIVFCVLAAMAVFRSQPEKTQQTATANPNVIYTKQDLDRAVQEALAKQEREQPIMSAEVVTPKSPKVLKSNEGNKLRRPFSKAERAQLAADLRLLSNQDEADLDVLGDRINK
ncbi:MAG TPA: zf-HC2 domain-containing protein [Pyrinomonadaceae bacterium]|nr:zf-HC2 domain-containing protein [Pyrinomonadaceae bacterium]